MIPGSLAQTAIRKTRVLHWHNSNANSIEQSMWLDGSSQHLTRSTSSHSSTECVMACWFQLNTFSGNVGLMGLGTGTSGSTNSGLWLSNGTVYFYANGNGATTNQLLRDIGWYHILASFKLDESTASNKGKLFINGEEVTSFASDPRSSWGTSFASTATQSVGSIFTNTFLKGYIAQAVMLDGQSIQGGDVAVSDFLDTWAFGDNGSQFVPKKNSNIAALASTAGGNSFCVDFADTSAFGNDISSNNNDLSDQGSPTAANQSRNSPSLQYPIINPLTKVGSAASTLSEGNTKATVNDNGGIVISDPLPSTGLWYFEIDATTVSQFYPGIGQQSALGYNSTGAWNNTTAETHVWLVDDASGRFNNNGSLSTYVGSASSTGRYAVAWDGDNRALYFGSISGSTITWVFSGDPTSGASKTGAAPGTWPTTGTDPLYFIVIGGGTSVMKFYFEEDDWTGVTNRPADAVELNTKNFEGPDYQGIDYFDATLYEGNGTGQRVGDFVPFTDSYTVDNSAMFNSADLRYLARTPSSGGNEKTFTFSTWIKMTGVGNNLENAVLTTDDGSKQAQIRISGTTLATKKVTANLYNGSSFILNISTDRTFGDTSSWNHLVVAYDTRAAVASADKVIIYINGVRQSVSGTLLTVDDYETEFNSTNEHNIGRQTNNAIGEPDFYLAETVMIDGQQLDATSFGQLDTSTNRWIPKDVSGLTFGTNGFYLEYESTFGTGSGAGTDTSGNSNNWTESTDGGSAWATTDQFTDTPSKNYPIFSRKNIGSATATLTEGNLKFTSADNGGFPITMQPTSGKWYFEVELDTAGTYYPGLFTAAGLSYTSTSAWAQTSSFVYLTNNANGAVYNGSTVVNGYNTGAMSSGDRLAIAWDVDNRLIYYGLASGGSTTFFSSGDPAAGTGAAPFDLPNERLYFGVVSGGTSAVATHHFISSGWEGAAPTGFSELNQDNLDDTSSKITALAWIKNRDATDNHMLANRVRGPQFITNSNSNSTGETTNVNAIQRFLQRGVQVGSDVNVNTANESYVLWQWLMGNSATTGTTTSPAGSIASTTIVADAGHMSIGTFTGTGSNGTVGHGLSAVPEAFVVFNPTVAARFKMFYHKDSNASPASGYLHLESTESFRTDSTIYNNTVPTSTVFSVGTNLSINESDALNTFIAWRSVPGVCKVGSYIGNSSTDGPYISLGFKPRWWLVKETTVDDAGHDWFVADSARYTYNGTTTAGGLNGGTLEANDTTAEEAHSTNYGNNPAFDFLSDGIKLRTNSGVINATGRTYVYMAMAEIGGNAAYPPIYGR